MTLANILFITLACQLISTSALAQVPQKFSYQAVVRDTSGNIMANKGVSFLMTIRNGSSGGPDIYHETHDAVTNQYGLVILKIGDGNNPSAIFDSINWGSGEKYLDIQFDHNGAIGGYSWSHFGTTQLLSVPYALYAENANVPGVPGPQGPAGLITNGASAGNTPYWDGSAWIINSSNIFNNGGNVGIGTTNPGSSAKLDVSSTTQGLLIPRMTTAERDAIVNPAVSLLIFNITTNCFNYYTGQEWLGLAGEPSMWYQDNDGDGFGNTSIAKLSCPQPLGYVASGNDCNDNNPNIHPNQTEICNGLDDNCDGNIDEGVGSTWYRDADGDGYGTSSNTVQACTQPVGYVSVSGDCNDGNPQQFPGATELCNGMDDDCDGTIDEGAVVSCASRPNAIATGCSGGICQYTCITGFANCDNNMNNGCETDLRTNIANCGACGRACANPANGVATCANGNCGVICNSGYGNCDGNVANGCEVNLQTSVNNCGSCGNVCPTPANGVATCINGTCGVICNPGYADCDNNVANGCEVNIKTSVSNCGSCGHVCPPVANAVTTCTNGICGFNCITGYTNCSGACVNLQSDPANCASCGRTCPSVANGVATCVNGSCSFTCNPGYHKVGSACVPD